MPHTTPVYALPYPDEADRADVPADIQALATRLEAVLPNVGIPTGAGVDWYAAVAPTGFLLCDGSAVSRTTFAALFAAIGTLWGGGNGSTTFNLPDTRGRVLVGVNPAGNVAYQAVGANDGTAVNGRGPKHSHGNALTLPAHAHAVNDPTHAHAGIPGDMGGPTSTIHASQPGVGDEIVADDSHAHVLNLDAGTAAAATGITIGNPTSAPAIPGTIGPQGGTLDAPSYAIVSKVIKT